jgi:hypothetical protein
MITDEQIEKIRDVFQKIQIGIDRATFETKGGTKTIRPAR